MKYTACPNGVSGLDLSHSTLTVPANVSSVSAPVTPPLQPVRVHPLGEAPASQFPGSYP